MLSDHPLLREVFIEPCKKGMYSLIYSSLISTTQEAKALPCRRGWELDLGDIIEEMWKLCLQNVPAISVSPSHKLLQLFLLHRAYQTTKQLYRWGRRDSPIRTKCSIEEGTLIHLM